MTGLAHAYLLDGKGGARSLDWAGVAAWQPADGVLWLNLDYSATDAQQWLASSGLEPIVREALLDARARRRTATAC